MDAMPFGKHKGTPVADVPTDYLEWLASKDDFKDPLKSVVDAELQKRKTTDTTKEPTPIGTDVKSLARRVAEAGGDFLTKRCQTAEQVADIAKATAYLLERVDK